MQKQQKYPMSTEAERGVLAAMLTDPLATATILGTVRRADFTTGFHQTLFDIAADFFITQRPVDLVTVSAEIRKRDKKTPFDLAELFNEFSGNWRIYMDMIREATRRREIMTALEVGIEKLATEKLDLEMILGEIMGTLTATEIKARRPMTLEKVTTLAIKRIEKAMEQKDYVTGIPTGFRSFDELIGGVQPGELMIVGARPSIGKSALLAGIAMGAAKAKIPSLIVNAEMELVEVGTRLLAAQTNIANFNLRRGQITDEDLPRIITASGRLAGLPIFIYDDTRWEVIKAQVRALKNARSDLGMVLIDYVGRIRVQPFKDEKRYEQIGRITKEAKDMARDLGVAVVLAAQLNRSLDKEHKRPTLSDLRESGDLEQDADIVSFLHKFEKDKERDAVWWLIAKNRNGPITDFKLYFNAPQVRFYEKDEFGL